MLGDLLEVRVAIGVETLGICEGKTRDHVVVTVEHFRRHDGVSAQVTRAHRRLAFVDIGDDVHGAHMPHDLERMALEHLGAAGTRLLGKGDRRPHGILLGHERIERNLAVRARHTAIRDLVAAHLIGCRFDTHGVIRSFDRNILEIAVLDLSDTGRALDIGLVGCIDSQITDHGEVGHVVTVEITARRDAHIGTGDLEAHEGKGPQRDQAHDRQKAAFGLFERGTDIAP